MPPHSRPYRIDTTRLVSSPQSKVEKVEKYFHKALETAQSQKAKSLELRAATNLARLWQQQGKEAEAHQMLSEIYGWFTEGFDTETYKRQ